MTTIVQDLLRPTSAPSLGVGSAPALAHDPAGDGPAAPYDALTDLFLGETAAPSTSSPRPAPAPVIAKLPTPGPSASLPRPVVQSVRAASIEALVMGHLPVRSGPWAAQFARATAERTGSCIALARLTAGELSIDLLGLPPEERESQSCSDVAAAIERAASRCAAWLIHLDEIDEPSLWTLPAVSAVTLLCAGTEASVVAAYQTMVRINSAMNADQPAGRRTLKLGVMGADETASAEIGQRLKKAAETFLRRPVELAAVVGKMGPTGAAPIFRGECALSPADLARAIWAAADRAAKARVAAPTPQPPAVPAQPASKPGAMIEPPACVPENRSNSPVAPSRPEVAKMSPDGPVVGALAARVTGLSPLAIRCPDEAGVELATDSQGRLHVLAEGDDGRAVVALACVQAWVSKHAALISAVIQARSGGGSASAAVQFNDSSPLQHLFTRDPRKVRPLLDTAVRLHVLAPVEVEGKTGWFHAELN